MSNARLRLAQVRFGYPGEPAFLGPIDFGVRSSALTAVVGPNGSGKSTLLRLAAGLLRPLDGDVQLDGESLRHIGGRRRATRIAFVPQHIDAPPGILVRDVVQMGRFPHRRFGFLDTVDDRRIVDAAMRTTGTSQFADRAIRTISAGEQQRVHLAAAAAQQPQLFILDEPTAALDPYYQVGMFSLLRRLCTEHGVAVLVATHDLNLAGQFADEMLLLDHGRVAAAGSPDAVLQPDNLHRVYGLPFQSFRVTATATAWVVPDATYVPPQVE